MDFTTNKNNAVFFNIKSSFNKIDENFKSGYNADGYLTNSYFSEKNIDQNNIFSEISLNYDNNNLYYNHNPSKMKYVRLENKLLYRFNYKDIKTDAYYYLPDPYIEVPMFPMNTEELTPTRLIHEATLINDMEFRLHKLEIFTQVNPSIYNSSTLTDKKMYFLLSSNLTFFWRSKVKLNANYSENVKEYPIYFGSLPFNTLAYNNSNFYEYQEMQYPVIPENIKPEK